MNKKYRQWLSCLMLILLATTLKAQTPCQKVVNPYYQAIDIYSHIHVNTEADILAKRDTLIDRFWKDGQGLRTSYPTDIVANIGSWDFINTTNFPQLARLDRYRVIMPCTYNLDIYEFEAYVYVCFPTVPTNKIMIVHEGHTPWAPSGMQETITYYLNKGYTILYCNMPLTGPNPSPDLGIFYNHDDLVLLESATFSPFSIFFDPITRSLNYLLNTNVYNKVEMIGVSGGGWTTVLYAAMDTRIKSSYSIAGTFPNFLAYGPCGPGSLGDYEQENTEVANSMSHLDLYILCSNGADRKHIQVVNQFDPCCNGGVQYQVYQEILEDKIICLDNGKFEILLDSSHTEHKISNVALNYINRINCDSSVVLSNPTHNYARGLHEVKSTDIISAKNKISGKSRVILNAKDAVMMLPGFEVTAGDCSSFVVKPGNGCN